MTRGKVHTTVLADAVICNQDEIAESLFAILDTLHA